jgi:hypothetical protein
MISDSFNSMVFDFLKELAEVFPEEKILKQCVDNFDSYILDDPKKPLNFMMNVIGENAHLVTAKDEKFFDIVEVPHIDVKSMWNSNISDNTKNAIWQYISTLMLIGTTMNSTSTEIMSGIEDLATEFAHKMQNGEMDISTMMTEVMGRVQQMDLSSLQNMDITSLTKSMGIDPADITNMMGGMMGGINPELLNTVSSLMGGAQDGDDLLKLLESAKPPQGFNELPKKNRTSKNGKKKNRKH